MNNTLVTQITEMIERTFDWGGDDLSKNIIIFPCGDVGIQAILIMREVYGLEPAYIIDNYKNIFSSKIKPISFLSSIDMNQYILLLCSTNAEIYGDLRKQVLLWEQRNRLVELKDIDRLLKEQRVALRYPYYSTQIGKYSYGALCKNHIFIKRIGAFCSFAEGAEVVGNHETHFISTHPMFYEGKSVKGLEYDYLNAKCCDWYFSDVIPKGMVEENRRITIGNDVWLGRNVIVTNSSNIGNGVIAGAGAVITRDVPDYAVVGGVPARIIRYRYTPEQIEALNRISWWDWPDEIIRERYDDFYLPIEDFISKYDRD